jgi:molybdopterin converting factor small subunit
MRVTVKLFAQYREGRFIQKEMELSEGTTVDKVINLVGLDLERYPVGIALVNGRHSDNTTALKEGDTLSLFPKVGGG